MLNKDRKQRLGQNKDVDEILTHPWFADINISDLLEKKIAAPFVPEISSKRDLQNFDPEVTAEELTESVLPEESKQIIKTKNDAFAGFGPMEKNSDASGSGVSAKSLSSNSGVKYSDEAQ